MIEFRDVDVRYGPEALLEAASFRINAGERVGVVGPNGAGKSTLFRLLLQDHSPDKGDVIIEGSPRIGHVRQHLQPDTPEETLLEYSLRGIPGLHDMECQIHALEHRLGETADESEKQRILRELGEVHSEFEHLGGYIVEARVKVALGGLGYATSDFDKPFISFSGGWRMRAELSRVLASNPDLLLLDEPSNYLDLPAVEWLQRYLKSYEGTLVLISHDRYLLRSLTSITLEVDGGTVTRYAGDLDYYLRERRTRYEQLLAAKANQDRKREQLERFVERFKAQATKASQAQSRAKQLEKMEEIKLPARSRSAGLLRIAPAPHAGAEIVRLEALSFGYDPANPILKEVEFSVMRGQKVAIVGYNGMGKTTLLRVLSGQRTPTAGRLVYGHHVVPGYQSQEFAETIDPDMTVFECAKLAAGARLEKEVRAALGSFGFSMDDTIKPARVLSGGEKIRLSFLRLFLNPPNFMLLDEPTTHLDMEGRESLEKALSRYDGTICVVSHDVEFVRAVADCIIEISPAGVRRFPGNYDYYREKRDEEDRRDGQTEPARTAEQKAAAPAEKLSSKDLRRQRAQERERQRNPEAKKYRATVEKLEKAIAALEAEQTALTAQLSVDGADYAAISKKIRDIQFKLHAQTVEWETAATALAELEQG